MARIKELMPYLEKGYCAFDPVRRAYLTPKKQDGTLMFEWKAYEFEGEWSGPDMHAQDYVLTWRGGNWGILSNDHGSIEEPENIERAIVEGHVSKEEGFE